MFRYCLCIIVGILCLSAVPATAEENSFKLSENWGQKLQNNMAAAWNAENYDLYLPINTWHNRLLYDKEKLTTTMKNRGEQGWANPFTIPTATGMPFMPWASKIPTNICKRYSDMLISTTGRLTAIKNGVSASAIRSA